MNTPPFIQIPQPPAPQIHPSDDAKVVAEWLQVIVENEEIERSAAGLLEALRMGLGPEEFKSIVGMAAMDMETRYLSLVDEYQQKRVEAMKR